MKGYPLMHKKISQLFEHCLDIAMFIIGILMFGLLTKQIIVVTQLILSPNFTEHLPGITDASLMLFLFFEIIVIVKEYYVKDAHLSIETFLFVAITALVRVILLKHENYIETLSLSFSVFILIVTLVFYRKNRKPKTPE